MTLSLVAVSTYGSHRIKHPRTGKTVSAYKIGYSGATSKVLLALFMERAQNVTPSRASYHYIHIDTPVTVKQGYILLRLTDDEIHTVEQITRSSSPTSVYRWRDGQWWCFSDNQHADYHLPMSSSPRFEGTGLRGTLISADDTLSHGIMVERSQRDPAQPAWFWLTGDTYPHRETLKRWGCRWSHRRKSWYYIGTSLPSSIQALVEATNTPQPETARKSTDDDDPCTVEEAARILGFAVKPDRQPDGPAPSEDEGIDDTTDPEPDEHPPEDETKIRIVPPPSLPDEGELDSIQQAIRQAKDTPQRVMSLAPAQTARKTLARIGQQYVGELTGSIAGNVYCYGYSVHEETLIFLNFGGPKMAVEAIRARLAKGETINLIPWDGPAIELTAGEGNTGMYSDCTQYLTEARFQNTILVHEMLTQPNYGGDSTTFIIRTSDEQAKAKLRHHITQLVSCAVFDEWTDYLWNAGHAAMLVRPTRSAGDIDLLTITLDADAWVRLITGGLATQTIRLQE